MATLVSEEKVKAATIYEEDVDVEKPIPAVEKTDYSGAHEKTDPKEIALVKKLDRWIMVSSPHTSSVDAQSLTFCSLCSGACIGMCNIFHKVDLLRRARTFPRDAALNRPRWLALGGHAYGYTPHSCLVW